jgi:Raf kinase inhibitor-like YbhB/YbcL family protein
VTRQLRSVLLPALLALSACGPAGSPPAGSPPAASAPAPTSAPARAETPLRLTSPDLHEGGTIPAAQVDDAAGCTGRNLSPALAWSGAPASTRSFAVTLLDTDAPVAGGFWHWLVHDIPASVTSLPQGAGTPGARGLPAGARQETNDWGGTGYGGPCPPAGDPPHHYVLTVSALDVAALPVPGGASPAQVDAAARAHTLASGRLTAVYGR